MIWFTSDTHFGHANIIKYSDRPFADIQEMDETLIANWNERVKPDDTVWHLGDVSFHNSARTRAIIDRLNGTKCLVLGNHDHRASKMLELGFDMVDEKTAVVHRNIPKPLYLSHRPQYREDVRWIQLCGHVHNQWATKRYTNGLIIINVGVDVRDYAPVSIEEIAALI